MKEQAISKINKVGKISTVVALICKILVILGLVCSLIGAIICLAVPESLVKVTTVEMVTTEIDYGALGVAVSEEDLDMVDTSEGQLQVTTVRNGLVPGNLEITSGGESHIITDISVADGVVKEEKMSGEITLTLRDVAGLMFVAMVSLIMKLRYLLSKHCAKRSAIVNHLLRRMLLRRCRILQLRSFHGPSFPP